VDVLEDGERRAVEDVLDVVRWRERHADHGGNRDAFELIVGKVFRPPKLAVTPWRAMKRS
jgi:hypothetical protein